MNDLTQSFDMLKASIISLLDGYRSKLDDIPIDPPVDPGPIDPPISSGELFIFHFDGNNNDDDDIAALPIAALYTAGAGLTEKMRFFYNNNRDEDDVAWQVEAMRQSAAFAESLGIRTYDYAADEAGTLAKLVELLSSGAKVTSFEGGPMGTIYRALEQTPVEFHKNITLVSHSQWNENRDNSGENKKWNTLKEKFPQVTYIDIPDQNAGFYSDAWTWLNSAEHPTLRVGRELMYNAKAKVNDASDSGMMYWYLTGNENGTVEDARQWLESKFHSGFSVFTEPEPGLIMGQAERFDRYATGWDGQSSVPGFSGSGYITYTSPDSFEGISEKNDIAELFTPTKSGTYQLQIHNRANDPSDPSQGNDSWVRVNGESFYADDNGTKVFAKGNEFGESNVTTANDSDSGYLKFYSNAAGAWTMQTSAIDNRPRPIMVELTAGNQYMITIAGRSNGHSIDAVFLRHVDLDPSVIDKYIVGNNPGPIDPPITPDLGSVEIVPQSTVIPGASVTIEAIVSSSLKVSQVDFYLNGSKYKTEKVAKYEAPINVPSSTFTIKVIVTFSGGETLEAEKVFEIESGGPIDPGPIDPPIDPVPVDPVGIELFDQFVSEASGTYYSLDAEMLPTGPLSESQVEAIFNTGASHMGNPNNRTSIDEVPGLPGRKAFTFIMNSESGGFGNRFSSQKTNDNNSTLYPDASSVASYSELYFDSEKFKMRTHFKSSSFTSKQGPPKPGSNSTGPNPRTSEPAQAEFVRWELYPKKSQSSPTNKGDMMALYFGQNTYWSAEDAARMDQPDNFVMGAGAYTAHPNLPYNYQNMLYPCKPDANGQPTRERLLMPTDKLIRSWMIWNGNTINPDGTGNYDGTAYWWLEIDGIHGGKPFLAGIVTNHLWTTGGKLVIGQAGIGAYFNTSDKPKEANQFYILKDIVWYQV